MGILDRLMGKKDAGAGRGFVNPKTVAEMNDEERSPAEREARQMMKDKNESKKADAAYNAAMPSPYKNGGSVSKRADGIAQRGKTRGKMC